MIGLGTLEGIGLPALVRFLAGLRSSGRLLVADDSWGGEVGFDEGGGGRRFRRRAGPVGPGGHRSGPPPGVPLRRGRRP